MKLENNLKFRVEFCFCFFFYFYYSIIFAWNKKTSRALNQFILINVCIYWRLNCMSNVYRWRYIKWIRKSYDHLVLQWIFDLSMFDLRKFFDLRKNFEEKRATSCKKCSNLIFFPLNYKNMKKLYMASYMDLTINNIWKCSF